MAQTMMASTGAKTWAAIKPTHDSGAWYRSVNVTKDLPMASRIPTGGFYNGYGAVLSHSYAQQFVTRPTESSIPGYWQGGGSAGGTQMGQMTRSHGYRGFGDIGDDVIKLQNQYITQIEAGNSSGAATTKVALDALKAKAEADKGTDWMDVLTTALEAGSKIYAAEAERAAETRARRRARARGEDYVTTLVPRTGTTGGGGYAPSGGNTMLYVGLAAAAAAVVGYMALR